MIDSKYRQCTRQCSEHLHVLVMKWASSQLSSLREKKLRRREEEQLVLDQTGIC